MPDRLPSLSRAKWLQQPNLQNLLHAIAHGGGEARVAGGAVRNALLGEAVTEVDIATNLPPAHITRICQAAGYKVHPTGIEHGTVTVVVHGTPFEVTTLRNDIATDGRRATVKFTEEWREDALRRDFTINAMYCDNAGKIYDYTNGYKDIRNRVVRFVGTPSQRILEDHLRILRFFRFHAHFAKSAPDKLGLAACIRLKNGIAKLSAERIRQETMKLLSAPRAVPTLRIMAKAGILRRVIPHTDEWRVIERLPPDSILRLAILANAPAKLKDALRLSNDEAKRIDEMLDAPAVSPVLRPTERRRILYTIGIRAWRDAVRLNWAMSRALLKDRKWQILLRLPDAWPIPQFPVKGRDLQSVGIAPGPQIGETLRQLEDIWIASDFKPTRDELLQKVTS
jgi:poly(A) polymerase